MYNVPTKMKVKKLAPSRKPTTLAPAIVLERKRCSGNSGASERDSKTKKPTSRATDTASRATVWSEPQPTSGAWEMA